MIPKIPCQEACVGQVLQNLSLTPQTLAGESQLEDSRILTCMLVVQEQEMGRELLGTQMFLKTT